MQRFRLHTDGSRGSALILFLGVAAAVSIIAAALIILIVNTQHGTAMERQRSKAFYVAEAALDVAMEELGQAWPTSATNSSWFNTQAFAARFPPNEFPGADATNPQTFVQVRLSDNTDATKSFDANGDGFVFVDAQARVGKRAARVHAEVQAIYMIGNTVRGLALWSGGDVGYTSTDSKPKVTVEVFPPADKEGNQPTASWAATGTVNPYFGASYMNVLQGSSAPTRQSILSDEKIIELTTLAQRTGRYFTSATAPLDTAQGYGGLCVINDPIAGSSVPLIGLGLINSQDQPGMLLVLGGATTIDFGGNTEFFGIVYSASTGSGKDFDRAHGTPVIHGMYITEGPLTPGGTPDIRYNDISVRGLNNQFPVGSRLVPGFWRELRPTM